MRKIFLILSCLSAIAMYGMTIFAQDNEKKKQLTAEEILEKAVRSIYPESYFAKIELENIKPGRPTKTYQLEVYRKGQDKTLAEITAPARERGQKILRVEDNLWMYFPNIQKAIRIGARDRLLGTDFNQGDVTRDLVKDYEPNLLGIEKLEGKDVYKLHLKARSKAVTYDKMLYWIDKETFFPVRTEMYSLSDKLLKVQTYSEPKELADRVRLSKAVMEDALVKDSRTIMRIKEMEIKGDLPDVMFTESYLKR
jgi:outer membrane lipoprotein-sorting protein